MKTHQLRVLVIILGVILVLGFVITSSYEVIVKSSLEKASSEALQTEVNIGSLDISPFDGNATLTNITIQNPKGFSDNEILFLPYLYASLELNSIFSDKVIINEIVSEDMRINFELNERGSNLNALQKNIDAGEKIVEQKESSTSQKVIIKELKINKSTLHASIAQQDALTIDLKDIYRQNIGEESNLTTAEAVSIVLESIIQSALRASSKISLKAGFESILQGTKDIGEGIKSIFE